MYKEWDNLSRLEKNRVLKHYDALVKSDNKQFQERARLLQSIWRKRNELPIGTHYGRKLGSRIDITKLDSKYSNFLTDHIREVVKEVLASNKKGLIQEERLLTNLLSSQPLCFNLFGELTSNRKLATKVFRDLTEGRIVEVEEIKFEYSPGRQDPQYTGDSSAFDVYVRFKPQHGDSGFVGIEVKYHENPYKVDAEEERRSYYKNHVRYEKIAVDMDCFLPEKLDIVRGKPIQQFWRDHLLVGSLKRADRFDDAFFAILQPEDNAVCTKAVKEYTTCLVANCESVLNWTLERFHELLASYSSADWINEFRARYLDFDHLTGLLQNETEE